MAIVELQSSQDGAVLSFSVTGRSKLETSFEVSVRTPWFSGKASASTYVAGSPSNLFRSMATEWKGWKKPKTWADLEDRVKFSATSDFTGHVKLAVELAGPDYDSRLKAIVVFEAGQLARMATDMEELLPPNAP